MARTSITTSLLIILGVCFFLELVVPGFEDAFILKPDLAFSQPWRLITSMFLHAGFDHLFFNALALLMFGYVLEARVTRNQYLAIYFIGGLCGSIFYVGTYLIGMTSAVPALGASGAIYAILGSVAILEPNMLIFFFGVLPLKMKYAAMLWFVIEFLGSLNMSSGVASVAHLGGLIFGLGYAYYLKKQKENEYAVYMMPPPAQPPLPPGYT